MDINDRKESVRNCKIIQYESPDGIVGAFFMYKNENNEPHRMDARTQAVAGDTGDMHQGYGKKQEVTMKFLFIVLTIRMIAKKIFGDRQKEIMNAEAGMQNGVRHPAEYLLR